MKLILPSNKSNRVVGLDWGTHSLKLMETIVNNGHVQIERIILKPVPVDLDRTKPEILGKWLMDIWREEKIKSRKVWLIIPRYEVLLTELELPHGDELETRQMVELRFERELTVPMDSVKSDYYRVSVNELGNQKIAVVSCKKEVIDYYLEIFNRARLNVEKMELSSLALHRAIQLLDVNKDSGIVIDIGYSKSEILITENKNLLYSRCASIGVGSLYPARDIYPTENSQSGFDLASSIQPGVMNWINRWVFEFKRSMEGYTMDTGKPYPSQMIMTGGGSRAEGLIEALRLKLDNSYQILDLKQYPSLKHQLDEKYISQFLKVFGLIHSGNLTYPSCDLLNSKLFARESHLFSSRVRQLSVGIGIGILAVLILLGALYKKDRDLSRLQAEYAQYKPLVAKSEQSTFHTSLIHAWKGNQSEILEILEELSGLWTEEVYLQVFSYDRGKDINLSGLAKSNQSVAELLARLTHSSRLKGTKFSYIRTSKRNPNYPIEFGLTMQYQKTGTIPKPMALAENQ